MKRKITLMMMFALLCAFISDCGSTPETVAAPENGVEPETAESAAEPDSTTADKETASGEYIYFLDADGSAVITG